MERFAKIAAKALSDALSSLASETRVEAGQLEIPPDRKMGDLAFPCFRLAKALKKNPKEIAGELAEKIGALPEISAHAVGPYVNFQIPKESVSGDLLKRLLSAEYTEAEPEKNGTWVIEFSSPNVAKPFLIGHLRSTALGAALSRIARKRGFRVFALNHLGDWGTQYGKLAVAFKRFGDSLPESPGIDDLVKIYVRFHEEAEKNPALEEEARAAFKKLEEGDPETTQIWERFVRISKEEFQKVYELLGVQFDHIWGESHYKELLGPLLDRLRKSKLLQESEGAWIVPVFDKKGKEITPCILQKKDGATIYATRDIAAAIYRHEKFRFDRMSYVVGAEQKLHFQQVFDVLRQDGHEWHSKCEHIPFGLYRFQGRKMSTRKGNFVTLREVLEETEKAVEEVMKNSPRAQSYETPEELAKTARKIALGAILFHDLSSDPVKEVVFDLDRVITFEGDTGPYLQYAHTRCQSILRKAAEQSIPTDFDSAKLSLLTHERELQLIKTLGWFPRALDKSLEFAKPSHLANYLLDVAQEFGGFYRECQVLSENRDLTSARLLLVRGTQKVLAEGLSLLGIPLPKKM